jgi:hypothetical protein
LAVTLASSFWAFWGIIEAFHEGWSKPHLWMRLLQVVAYLSPATVLCVLTVLGIRWPRVGATLFVLAGVIIAGLMIWDRAYFGVLLTAILTAVPALVGLLFLVGRPTPKRLAYAVSVGIPLLIVFGFGAEGVVRVNSRFDDGDRGARLIEGNEVALLWAPAGPGWTRGGLAGWDEAVRNARHLTEDGTALDNTPQDIWRLPSREEIVRSMTRGGRNAGGDMGCAKRAPKLRPPPRQRIAAVGSIRAAHLPLDIRGGKQRTRVDRRLPRRCLC